MVNLLPQPTGWGVQNLVDQILNTGETELAELTLDDAVGGDSCAVYSDLNTRVIISERNLTLIE